MIKRHEDGWVYNLWVGTPFINSGKPKELVMQRDGNLVVYREDGQAMWASGTSGDNNSLVI